MKYNIAERWIERDDVPSHVIGRFQSILDDANDERYRPTAIMIN